MKLNEWDTWKRGPKAGQPRSFTDRVIRWLVEYHKAQEVQSYSLKYRTFKIESKPGQFYFVGHAGAVRVGKNSSSSISLTDSTTTLVNAYDRLRYPDEIH